MESVRNGREVQRFEFEGKTYALFQDPHLVDVQHLFRVRIEIGVDVYSEIPTEEEFKKVCDYLVEVKDETAADSGEVQ